MNEGVDFALFWSLFGTSVIAAAVVAVLCGVLGFFVVVRRVAFVSSALGQLSGLGVALGFLIGALFGHDPHEPTPVYLDPVVIALALTAAVAAATAYVSRLQRTPPETAVAFVYLVATALAILALSSPLIVLESHEVMDLLFGQAVAVRREHLAELIVVAAVVLLCQLVFFKDFLFASFDRETARALGLPVAMLDLGLHLSIGLSVAVSTRAMGALPVFGLLVLPSGAALMMASSVRGVIGLSVAGALLSAGVGFFVSYVESLPTGPTMVVCAAMLWPAAGALHLVHRFRGRRSARQQTGT